MKLLLIEDDKTTSDYIVKGLKETGHVIDALNNGRDGLIQALNEPYDTIILDRLLPGLDGLSIIRSLRGANNRTPVLFLTAVGGVDDRVEGLEAGGDDYIVKPFAFAELLARLNALSRRPPSQTEKTSLSVADLELDLIRRTCRRGDRKVDLLPREFVLLEYLMRNEGRVVTRTMLLDRIWGFQFDPQTSVVETQISRLRSKIDQSLDLPLLKTIRNVGYSLHAN
jgi:two-component system OmpR family response regulator